MMFMQKAKVRRQGHFIRLVQHFGNSIAHALELLRFCTKPTIFSLFAQ